MAQPKLGDVAARAGVSPTTVSRVLNNRGYLSQKTREKVFAAIRELGYRPNAIARSLQERRSHIIGLIFPTVAHPFYGEMVYRLESRLVNAGYRVILCNSDEQPELEHRYLDMLFAHQVDGIITGSHSQAVAQLPQVQAPLVAIDRPETGPYPNIRSDNYAGARQATEHLIGTGARRILHITSTVSEQNLRQRGYADALTAAGLSPDFLELGFHESAEHQRNMLYKYLDEHRGTQPVEAVFASNDTYASLALAWAQSRRVQVPEEFQVIGFDGTDTVHTLLPELASVVQPIDALAERAVQRLTEVIAAETEEDAEPADVRGGEDILPVTLRLGGTVRSARD